MAQYEDYFKDHFKKMGDYDSVFIPKTRAKTMAEKERRMVDGSATFYKTSRYFFFTRLEIQVLISK